LKCEEPWSATRPDQNHCTGWAPGLGGSLEKLRTGQDGSKAHLFFGNILKHSNPEIIKTFFRKA